MLFNWAVELRACLCVLALVSPSFVPGLLLPRLQGAALAGPAAVPEAEAFDAAKELGTLDAWKAFLANYPTDFRADLARAYVKKLEDSRPPQTVTSSDLKDFPTPAATWGGVVRHGEGQQTSSNRFARRGRARVADGQNRNARQRLSVVQDLVRTRHGEEGVYVGRHPLLDR